MKIARVTLAGAGVALSLWCFASTASAAFPGANGILAVQPVSGGGILLVKASGQTVRRICPGGQSHCAVSRQPRWSPDGRAIVSSGPHITIVYTDGSCMNCQFGAAANPVFEPGGTVISFIQRHRDVTLDGIDGTREPTAPLDAATDAVWSADGKLAVVWSGWLWVGHPDPLRRIAPGRDPSWSPGGDRLVAVQRGWVVIVRAGDRHVQRLARGSAPAFSPDGRWIAFVAPRHRLMIVAASGGRARPVGRVKAQSVDWQPIPLGPNPGCAAPPGSTVLASAPDSIVTGDGPGPPFGFSLAPADAYMGCLPADGRERLLERFIGNNADNATWVKSAVLAAPYAALVAHSEDEHYGGSSDVVQVFDLSSGLRRRNLGGEDASCEDPACTNLAQVVLGRDGVSAARTYAVAPLGSLSSPLDAAACAPGSTVCLAADEDGRLLTSTNPAGGAGSWSAGKIAPSSGPGLTAVACPAVSLCVAVESDIYHSSDPAGGASTWRTTKLGGSGSFMYDITCPTATLCVAIRYDNRIATSRHPAGGTAAWTVTKPIAPAAVSLDGIFCSAEPRCFVTNDAGAVLTSSDPAGGPGAWTKSGATPELVAGACPTSRLCVTVGLGEIATSTAPDAQVWTRRPIADDLFGVSCPTSSLCVAVGNGGAVYVSTDPASGTWSHTIIDYGIDLSSVSCASASLCMATDDAGHVLTATDPAGGPSAWAPALLEGDSCTDGHACTIETIEASDKTGLHTVDSSRLPGPGQVLSGLTLTGDTLSWTHAGSPRSVSLTPP